MKNKIDLPNYDNVQAEKIFDNLLFGYDYYCFLNPRKVRGKIGKKLKVGDPIGIQPYQNENGYYYLAIEPSTGLDFGIISPGTAKYIHDNYPSDAKFVGKVIERGKITSASKKSAFDEIRIEYKLYI